MGSLPLSFLPSFPRLFLLRGYDRQWTKPGPFQTAVKCSPGSHPCILDALMSCTTAQTMRLCSVLHNNFLTLVRTEYCWNINNCFMVFGRLMEIDVKELIVDMSYLALIGEFVWVRCFFFFFLQAVFPPNQTVLLKMHSDYSLPAWFLTVLGWKLHLCSLKCNFWYDQTEAVQ